MPRCWRRSTRAAIRCLSAASAARCERCTRGAQDLPRCRRSRSRPDLIASRFRRYRKRAERIEPDSPASAYHRLRSNTKRLRYALEFLADLYPNRIRRLIDATHRGARHSRAVPGRGDRQPALRGLADEHGDELPPRPIFAMGEIAERYRHSMADLRRQFPAAFASTKGKNWRSVRKRLEASRPSTPVAATPAIPTRAAGRQARGDGAP